MQLTSTAFRDGQPIPPKYSRDGGDASPPLAWSDVPRGTQSLALTCDDPDAPGGTWVHWVLFDLPGAMAGLPAGVEKGPGPKVGGVQGENSYGDVGWGGPQPPKGHGVHHYEFRLYALDKRLGLKAGASRAEFAKAIAGHVLAEAQLTGTYRRD